MKVSHDKEANNGNNDTPEFYSLVRGDAASKVVGDGLIEQNHGTASEEDNEADDEPADTEIPIHKYIIAQK